MIYNMSFGVLSGHFQEESVQWITFPALYSNSTLEIDCLCPFLALCISIPSHYLSPLTRLLSYSKFSTAVFLNTTSTSFFPHQEINTACKYRSCVFYCHAMPVTCKNILRSGEHPASSEKMQHVCLCMCVCLCAFSCKRQSFFISTVRICVGLCGR